jgi:hypothetical protein
VKQTTPQHSAPANTSAGIRTLQKFCEDMGKTQITAWRWRQLGWLETTNIAGRQYVTDEAIEKFKRRAVAGEFAKVHKVPSKGGVQ